MRIILLMFGLTLSAQAAGPGYYRMDARLLPTSGELKVNVTFQKSVAAGSTTVKFGLNKGLHVISASCEQCSSYSFATTQPAGIPFVRDGAALVFTLRHPLLKDRIIRFHVSYEGKLITSSVNSLKPDWIELAMYSAWFPLASSEDKFTYDLRVSLDPAYRLTGAGKIREAAPGQWRIRQQRETFDINLLASTQLHNNSICGGVMQLESAGLTPAQERQIVRGSATTMGRLTQWFGPTSSPGLTVVFAPRTGGGGYSRPGLVCYELRTLGGGEERLLRDLAHEMGHLWWIGAPVTTWEDWLNEGFAEYTSLMVVRDELGDTAFETGIAELKREAQGMPPIRGISRSSDKAYTVLYMKGALVLYRLEQELGREKFRQYLAKLASTRSRSVDGALDQLEQCCSASAKASVEKMLLE